MKFLSTVFKGIVLTCLCCAGLQAQVKMITAQPDKISKGVQKVHSADIALYDQSANHQQQLILMIQGTGGSATGMHTIDSIFATFGFHVISIDYKNNVISTVCLHSKDTACADNFRREIITGDPVSELVTVDSVNSILNRFSAFLTYLSRTDPAGGWDKFIRDGKPRWERIIVGGHSQGAGHAAYLGKMFPLARVLIFSGPQDYLEDLHMPAPWLSMKSVTPPDKYFAFLSLEDPFKISNQIKNCEKLMQHDQPDTAMVQPGQPVQGHHQILVNSLPVKDPHGVTLSPEFSNVWAYMLGLNPQANEKEN